MYLLYFQFLWNFAILIVNWVEFNPFLPKQFHIALLVSCASPCLYFLYSTLHHSFVVRTLVRVQEHPKEASGEYPSPSFPVTIPLSPSWHEAVRFWLGDGLGTSWETKCRQWRGVMSWKRKGKFLAFHPLVKCTSHFSFIKDFVPNSPAHFCRISLPKTSFCWAGKWMLPNLYETPSSSCVESFWSLDSWSNIRDEDSRSLPNIVARSASRSATGHTNAQTRENTSIGRRGRQ